MRSAPRFADVLEIQPVESRFDKLALYNFLWRIDLSIRDNLEKMFAISFGAIKFRNFAPFFGLSIGCSYVRGSMIPPTGSLGPLHVQRRLGCPRKVPTPIRDIPIDFREFSIFREFLSFMVAPVVVLAL